MCATRVSCVVILLAALLGAPGAVSAGAPGTVAVQILAFNDFHGNILPPSGSSGRVYDPVSGGNVDAGGAVYLATHIQQLAATNPNTVLVSGGDLIGASPLISALFHDEPTIEMANLLGMDLATVGNHEFDEGWHELLRMQRGGCHPIDGCEDGDPFYGLDGKFLSASVIKDLNDQTLFPSYRVLTFDGAKVAFIGIDYEFTPSIVVPSGVEGVTFLPEISTVNALISEFKQEHVKNFVVILHDGSDQAGSYNGCEEVSQHLIDLVSALDDEVDVVITGHTHNAYNCLVGDKIVTGAMSNGRVVTDIDLTINTRSGDITGMTANNVIVTRDVPADPAMQALVEKYNNLVMPIAGEVIGSITADITRTVNDAGESALGDVVCDAQLYDTAPPDRGGAVVAFTNTGGIRADLTYDKQYYQELPGEITYGEAFEVQPFYNNLVTMDLTGTQIDMLLEQQFTQSPYNILQVSAGFTYQWSTSAPDGEKVDPATIMLNGVVIDLTAIYRVTVSSYLAGGDNSTVLTEGANLQYGGMDCDALAHYLSANSPVAPGPMNRIVNVP